MDPLVMIANKSGALSKSQRKVAQYVLEHPNEVLFLTVEKLAKTVGVSDATVVRFASAIGYKGYPDFQYHLQNRLQKKLKTTERLQNKNARSDTMAQRVINFLEKDQQNVQSNLANLDLEVLEQVTESLLKARRVYIVASRSSAAVASYFHYYLNMLLGNVALIQVLETESEQLLQLNQNDVTFAISTARYTKSTIEIFKYAKQKKSLTIALTDQVTSPLVPYADMTLYATSEFPSFFDSMTAYMSLVNVVLGLIAQEQPANHLERLEQLEVLWEDLNVFY